MPNGKKILVLSSWYPSPNQPHLGNFVQRQAALLAKDNDVYMIQTCPSQDVKDYSMETTITDGVKEIRIFHPIGRNFYSRRAIEKQALDMALAKLSHIDLLWTQIILPKGWQFYYVRRTFNCKWVHFESGSYFRSTYRKWKWTEKAILKTCLRKIDSLYSVSESHRSDLAKFVGNKQINIIPNHIDCTMFGLKEKTRNDVTQFLHISTLDKQTKDPVGIFKACEILSRNNEKFHLSIICDDDHTPWIKLIEELKLQNYVSLIGATPWEELPNWYHKSDAFILNSIYESFSIVIAETLATGTPVITTPVGIGVDISPTMGLESEIGNPESLASNMKAIIYNEVSFDTSSMRSYAMQFDATIVQEKLNNVVHEYTK